MSLLRRFSSKVEMVESGCHEWRSTLHRDGYGKFWFDGKQIQSHRMAWLLYVGEITDGLWVLHKCDNRKCVNPDHLYLGNAKQNTRDKVERCPWWGNMRVPFEIVQTIRQRYLAGGISQQSLADEYGLHQTQVSKLIRGTQRIHK